MRRGPRRAPRRVIVNWRADNWRQTGALGSRPRAATCALCAVCRAAQAQREWEVSRRTDGFLFCSWPTTPTPRRGCLARLEQFSATQWISPSLTQATVRD
jgi:hypothetical protein